MRRIRPSRAITLLLGSIKLSRGVCRELGRSSTQVGEPRLRWCRGDTAHHSSRRFLCSRTASPAHWSCPTRSEKLYFAPSRAEGVLSTRTSSTGPAGSSTGSSKRKRPSTPTSPLVFRTRNESLPCRSTGKSTASGFSLSQAHKSPCVVLTYSLLGGLV